MRRKIAGLIIVGLLALSGAGGAQAADGQAASGSQETVLIPGGDMTLSTSTTKGPFYDQSEGELRMRKLTRGVCNVTLCVAEIPNQMFHEAAATSPVTGIVVGAFKGVGMGLERFAIGIWEVVTFYHPGSNHYQPLIEPEVVFQDLEH